MIPCVYHFYQDPVQMVRGEGQYVFDHTGKKYLDFYAGVSVLNAGHCHPEIVDKICEQVKHSNINEAGVTVDLITKYGIHNINLTKQILDRLEEKIE